MGQGKEKKEGGGIVQAFVGTEDATVHNKRGVVQ